jgi:hypothetical protein
VHEKTLFKEGQNQGLRMRLEHFPLDSVRRLFEKQTAEIFVEPFVDFKSQKG